MNSRKPPTKTIPPVISSPDKVPTSLQTPTINNKAKDILDTVFPTLSIFFPENFVTSTNAPTNITNPITNAAAFPRSGHVTPDSNFTTPTKSNKETDIFIIMVPALSMF